MGPTLGVEAVGAAVELYFAGGNCWVAAEVLAYSHATGRHLLLYADGEDEWVTLQRETLRWGSLPATAPGIPPGTGYSFELSLPGLDYLTLYGGPAQPQLYPIP